MYGYEYVYGRRGGKWEGEGWCAHAGGCRQNRIYCSKMVREVELWLWWQE